MPDIYCAHYTIVLSRARRRQSEKLFFHLLRQSPSLCVISCFFTLREGVYKRKDSN